MSFVYLEKKAGMGIYRCRGKLGPKDDFDSFKSKMAMSGLDAFESDELHGREIKVTVTKGGKQSITVVEV